jgi:hypothetical protein
MAHLLHCTRHLIKYKEVARPDLNKKAFRGLGFNHRFFEVNVERQYDDCESSNILTISSEIGGKR